MTQQPEQQGGEHRRAERDEPQTEAIHYNTSPSSSSGSSGNVTGSGTSLGYTGNPADQRTSSSNGVVVAVPTTDQHGAPTGTLQAKIIAVLGSTAGVTVLGALVAAVTGVQLDPVLLTAIVGGGTGLIGTIAGYVTTNRSRAN